MSPCCAPRVAPCRAPLARAHAPAAPFSPLAQLTATTHPPGGATALIAGTLTELPKWHGYSYLVTIAVGSVIMQAIALVINNLDPRRRYPTCALLGCGPFCLGWLGVRLGVDGRTALPPAADPAPRAGCPRAVQVLVVSGRLSAPPTARHPPEYSPPE